MNTFLNFLFRLSGPLNKTVLEKEGYTVQVLEAMGSCTRLCGQRKYDSYFLLIAVHNLLCVIFNKINLSNSRAPNYCMLDIIKLLIPSSAVGLLCQQVGPGLPTSGFLFN